RKDAQGQDLGFGSDDKGDHESDGLIARLRQRAETAGHGQNLGHGRLAPAVVEAAAMQRGRDRPVERPERLQPRMGDIVAPESGGALLDAAPGADDARTSGARKYKGVGGKPVRWASERAA